MESLLPALDDVSLDQLRGSLCTLKDNPPQSLLLEGGREAQRLQMGQFWAMSANCPNALGKSQAAPCLDCTVCRQIAAFEFSDLFAYDGRISNTEDRDNPGLVRCLHMDNMRVLKRHLSSPPNGKGKRVVIFQGMTNAREEAMNSLLKILEEPQDSTLYVLLTSQRDQILPTLLSRSLCLTLPWTDCLDKPEQDLPLLNDLAIFLENGTSFFTKISASKGVLDNGGQKAIPGKSPASLLLLECQKSIARIMAGKSLDNPLDKILGGLTKKPEALSLAYTWANEAHVLLQANVSPVRVFTAFAARLHDVLHS